MRIVKTPMIMLFGSLVIIHLIQTLKLFVRMIKKALDDFSGNFRGQVGYIDKQFNYHYPTEWPDRLEFNRNFPGLSRNAKWFDEKRNHLYWMGKS